MSKEAKNVWISCVKGAINSAPHMCATCSRYKEGECTRFGTKVPEKFLYEKSDCSSWATLDLSFLYEDMEVIPF